MSRPHPAISMAAASPRPLSRLSSAFALSLTLLSTIAPCSAQVERFEGIWNVVLTCPPHQEADDDARGYTHRFPAKVTNGQLEGTYGTVGEIGYHYLHGTIRPDGTANLRLDGIVNNPNHAIKKAQRGKPYTYRVSARFDEKSGTGQRDRGRVCEFKFSR